KYSAALTNATRLYSFNVTGSNFAPTNTPGGTLICQGLISQNRNTVDAFYPTGTVQVLSGQVVNMRMEGKTSAQYDDVEPLVQIPNTFAHILNLKLQFELPTGLWITNATYAT